MKYILFRITAGVMFSLLAAFAGLLAMELLGELHLRYVVPRINPYLDETRIIEEEMDALPLLRADSSALIEPGKAPLGEGIANAWEIPSKHELDGERAKRYTLFPDLDEASRMRFAISHAESVLVFDAQDELTRVYSDWLKQNQLTESIGRWLSIEQLQSAVRHTRLQGVSYSTELTINGRTNPDARVEASFLPVAKSGEVFAYIPLELAALKTGTQGLPGDSRWDVYCLSYKPNLRDIPHNVRFSSNSFGFRAPDVELPKPNNTYRILCIGGSTTHEGADNQSTYPALLEQLLRVRFPGNRIEVLNCGIEGILTRSQVLRIPDYLALEPDLVIAYEGINDVANDVQDYWNEKYPPCQLFKHTLCRILSSHFWPSAEQYHAWIRASTIQNLDCLRRIFAAKGIPLALCSNAFPNYDEISWEQQQFFDSKWYRDGRVYSRLLAALNQEIREYATTEQLLYIPVAENMNPAINYLLDFCHMNAIGIERKAEIILSSLDKYIAEQLAKKNP